MLRFSPGKTIIYISHTGVISQVNCKVRGRYFQSLRIRVCQFNIEIDIFYSMDKHYMFKQLLTIIGVRGIYNHGD